jgi:NADP-dependent 3-hydroxy acid dehydrogenase YdfG
MGKLEGKIALIAGGTGGVGEGITQAFEASMVTGSIIRLYQRG